MKSIKTKQAILYCLFAFIFTSIKAQINMVQDPSFEDTTLTVNGLGQLSLRQWRNLDSNRINSMNFSYYSYTSTLNIGYSLPSNQWCNQTPRTGGGIELDFIWVYNPNWKRSLARTKLTSSLVAGKTYCAKMYVNVCDKYYDTFTDGIAMYFDNGQLDTIVAMDSSGVYPFVNPQVSNPQGNVLMDTVNWVLVGGTFVANGTETFLTIGNFKTDSNTTKVVNLATHNPNSPWQYGSSGLLIDDVSVYEITASNWLHDTTIVLGDSAHIGTGNGGIDAQWFDDAGHEIGLGSGLWVTPTSGVTMYVQGIDVCVGMIYDTMYVYAYPLGISELGTANDELIIYPNPTHNKFQIICKIPNSKKELFNSLGQLVFSTYSNEIDVSGYSKGVYYLKCGRYIRKLVVE